MAGSDKGKPPEWALGPWGHTDVEPGVEVRPNPDGTIDEIVFSAAGAFFHLEQMDDGQYWIGISWKDDAGEDRMQHIMLTTRRKAPIYPTVYR